MDHTSGHPVGEVTVNDAPTKTKLYRFCEKKIDQWVRAHTNEEVVADSNASDVLFRVSFTEEEDIHQVSCVTEINYGGAVWRGCELASDTQQAFIHSLKRLQPH